MGNFFPILEALLAFALTMFLLASAVSAIVGGVLRLMRSRSRNLRKTIDLFYRRDMVHALADLGDAPLGVDQFEVPLPYADDLARRSFIAEMTLVPNATAATESRATTPPLLPRPGVLPSLGLWHDLGRSVDALPEAEFKSRLMRTRSGLALLGSRDKLPRTLGLAATATDDQKAEAFFDELTARYSAYAAAAAESLQRRTRPWHIVAAFGLVLCLKVDAIEIVKTYLRDPEVTQKVIELGLEKRALLEEEGQPPPDGAAPKEGETPETTAPGASDLLTAAIKKLDALTTRLNAATPETVGSLADEAESVRQLAESARREIESTHDEVNWLLEGLPVTSEGFPFCEADSPDPRCDTKSYSKSREQLAKVAGLTSLDGVSNALRLLFPPVISGRWLLGWLLTSLMVGLGTSIWLAMVDRLLGLREFFRGAAPKPATGAAASTP